MYKKNEKISASKLIRNMEITLVISIFVILTGGILVKITFGSVINQVKDISETVFWEDEGV